MSEREEIAKEYASKKAHMWVFFFFFLTKLENLRYWNLRFVVLYLNRVWVSVVYASNYSFRASRHCKSCGCSGKIVWHIWYKTNEPFFFIIIKKKAYLTSFLFVIFKEHWHKWHLKYYIGDDLFRELFFYLFFSKGP